MLNMEHTCLLEMSPVLPEIKPAISAFFISSIKWHSGNALTGSAFGMGCRIKTQFCQLNFNLMGMVFSVGGDKGAHSDCFTRF